MNLLTGLSLIGFLAILGFQAWRDNSWKAFLFEFGGLAAFTLLLNALFGFPFPQTLAGKGATQEWVLAIALYGCMVAGMFSQYIYRVLEKQQPIFTWRGFVAPLFASPIVFIPLLASFEGTGIDVRNTPSPRLMIFLVAFQNGFFWKEYFDSRRKGK